MSEIILRKYHGVGNDYLIFDPKKNDVVLNERLIRQLCRRNIGVGADGILYGPVMEDKKIKVRIFNPDGSEAEMIEAATIAQATEFIDQKKKKYKSPISQGGANVSGGQKQRLSIARAIAKHPDVYIFDDSFSALDYKTDATLRAELKEKTAESTVMIVAQRISTILHADQIIVLDEGNIVGKGTHEELLNTCPVYQQIAKSQLSEDDLKKAREVSDHE